MKEDNKKFKFNPEHEVSAAYSNEIEEIAQMLTEGMQEPRTTSLEPFEVYAERIKSKLFADPEQFRARFSNGYQLLLEELLKEK